MRKAIRDHLRDFIAIIVLAAVALLALYIILYNQKAALPSWVPGLGQDFYELNGEFTSAQAVIPGQGQAIDIAGIQVGKVGSVTLEDGHANVRMDIEPKYAKLIHKDAQLLLRPKTGLNDMVIEVAPGTKGKTPSEGSTIPLAQTQPNVNPDEFLQMLDADTRDYLALLLNGGAVGLGHQGRQLSAGLRRFEPLSRDLAKIGGALALRRHNIARSIHNFRLILDELGANDRALSEFVSSSNAVLGTFADQQAAIRQSLQELPPTLRATQKGLTSADQFIANLEDSIVGLLSAPMSSAMRSSRETQ